MVQRNVESAGHLTAQVGALAEKENSLGSSAELTLLESSKLAQLAAAQQDQAGQLHGEAGRAEEEVEELDRKIQDMILYLENHGRGRGSGVSLTNALQQASQYLNHIESQDFS